MIEEGIHDKIVKLVPEAKRAHVTKALETTSRDAAHSHVNSKKMWFVTLLNKESRGLSGGLIEGYLSKEPLLEKFCN